LVFSLLFLFSIVLGLLAESFGSWKKQPTISKQPSSAGKLFKTTNRKHQKWISIEIPFLKTKKYERNYGQEIWGLFRDGRESDEELVHEQSRQEKPGGNYRHNFLMTNKLSLPMPKSIWTLRLRLGVLESAKISIRGKSGRGNANAEPREGEIGKEKREGKPKVKIKLMQAGGESSRVGPAVLKRLVRRASGFGPLKETAEQDLSAALAIGSVVEEPVAVMVVELEDARGEPAVMIDVSPALLLSSDSEIF
jgi:hypothetical protein